MKAHAQKMVEARTKGLRPHIDDKPDTLSVSTAPTKQNPCKKVEPFLRGKAFNMWSSIPLDYAMGLVTFVEQHLRYVLRQRLTSTLAERYYGHRNWAFSFDEFFARFKKFKRDLKNARRFWKRGPVFDFDPVQPAPKPMSRDQKRFLRKNVVLSDIKIDYSGENERRSKEQVYAQAFLMQNRRKIPGLSEAITRAFTLWPDSKEEVYNRLVQLKRRMRMDFSRRSSLCHTGRKAECVRKISWRERPDSWQLVRLAAERYIDQFK